MENNPVEGEGGVGSIQWLTVNEAIKPGASLSFREVLEIRVGNPRPQPCIMAARV